MPTVKLVVIGASGVGKTSLRGKYISGRFSAAYRATIGADFITKTLPHPNDPAQSVTLQIWDTAGQERFSSLSAAFFRGADAALLMFDVNSDETMESLRKWWKDFRDQAPVADEDIDAFPCVVVGNKIDMISPGRSFVTESEALVFLDSLIPSSSSSPEVINSVPPSISIENTADHGMNATTAPIPFPSSSEIRLPPPPTTRTSTSAPSGSLAYPRSNSIDITPNVDKNNSLQTSYSPKHQLTKSRSRSGSRFYSGTMTTTHTTLTIYHTPSSSLFDVYQSARSSPEPWSSPSDNGDSVRQRRLTMLSTGSTSSGSAVTITPSLFAREAAARSSAVTSTTSDNDDQNQALSSPFSLASAPPLPTPPDQGPKLFFASAKTGEGVNEIFEYIAHRVVKKWEYEELMEARRMHYRDASAADTIRLGLDNAARRSGFFKADKTWNSCCSS